MIERRSGFCVQPDRPSDAQVQSAVNSYLEENPPSGATAQQTAQIEQNAKDIISLATGIDYLADGAKYAKAPTEWTTGNLYFDSGNVTIDQSLSWGNSGFFEVKKGDTVHVKPINGWQTRVYLFDVAGGDYSLRDNSDTLSTDEKFITVTEGYHYCILTFRNAGNTNVAITDCDDNITVDIITETDDHLKIAENGGKIAEIDERLVTVEDAVADQSVIKTDYSQGALQVSSNTVTIASSTVYSHSDFIPVIVGKTYRIIPEDGYSTRVYFVDSNDGTYTERNNSDTLSADQKDITAPLAYMLLQIKHTDGTAMNYTECADNITVIDLSKFDDTQDFVSSIRPNELNADFFLSSAKVPLISWIDDEGNSDTNLNAVKAICEALGIRCSFAAVMRYIDPNNPFVDRGYSDTYNSNMLNTWLEMQADGYHFANHGYHYDFWKNGDTRDLKLCKEDFIRSTAFLKTTGLIDTDLWVSPYGMNDTDIQTLLLDAGAVCSVTTHGYNNHYWQDGRYDIYRHMILTSNTLDFYKDIIDTCYENGDWLIFGTYANKEGYWDADLITSILQYALDKGIEIVPFNVAWHRRHLIYDYYDYFK